MANKIQIRRDISVFWSNVNPILSQGEPGFETDTGRFKIGNGITSWNVLPYLTSNLEIITANLQNQIDYVKSNLNSAALDSLSEIVTAFQAFDANVFANVSTIQTLVANLEINAGVQHTAISMLESNAGVQHTAISMLESNAGVQHAAISMLESNAGVQHTAISMLESNAGVQHTAISMLESNASVQQANITLLLNERDRLVNGAGNLILDTGGNITVQNMIKFSSGALVDSSNNNIEIRGIDNFNIESRNVVNIYTNTQGNVYQWQFDDNGNLTLPQTAMNVSPAPTSLPGIRFTDGSLQTKAFTGTEFPTNIVNTHGGSAVIYVGGTEASSESLYVRVANVSSTLGVEVKYSHAVTSSISAFREYPNPANIYAGLFTKSGSNNDYDNFGNLSTVGDSMSVSISDHSNHKIYRVLVTARSMPGSGVAGDAYCVIEKLK